MELVQIDGPAGPLPLVTHAAADPRGTIIGVQPFLEEANRSRRLFGLVGRGCAKAGWTFLLPDLPGSGESPVEPARVRWIDWRASLTVVIERAAAQGPVRLLGVRLGALLAAEAALAMPVDRLVALAPVERGDVHLRHWLRVAAVGSKEFGPERRVSDYEAELAAGASVRVAGYELAPGFAADLAAARWPDDARLRERTIPVAIGEGASTPGAARHLPGSPPWLVSEPREPSALAQGLVDILAGGEPAR